MGILSTAITAATGGTAPLIATAAIGGLVLSLAGGVAFWFHEHDARIVAQVAAQQAAVVAAAEHDQDQRTIRGQAAANIKAATVTAANIKIKEAINATPSTTACAGSPAVTALLDGLRGSGGGSNSPAKVAAPGNGVAVPGTAASPVR